MYIVPPVLPNPDPDALPKRPPPAFWVLPKAFVPVEPKPEFRETRELGQPRTHEDYQEGSNM